MMTDFDVERATHLVVGDVLESRAGSLHVVTRHVPTKGYMVGGQSWSLTVTPEQFDSEIVRDYVVMHREMLKDPDMFLGWWTDPKSGRICLDVSRRHDDYSSAMFEGIRNREMAIYDLNKGESIPL